MSDIYVYEPTNEFTTSKARKYKPTGVVDIYESLQWLEYYQEAGEVLLVCPFNEQNQKVLKVGNLLRYERPCVMIIEQVELSAKSGKPTLTVRGETYASVLAQRIGENTTVLQNFMDLVYFMKKNFRLNGLDTCIKKESALESITFFIEASWVPLIDVLENVCKETGTGFRCDLIEGEQCIYNQLIFYNGLDLTSDKNYIGYIGGTDDIDNLKLIESVKEYKNVAFVVGKEKDGATFATTVQQSNIFEHEHREVVISADDIAHEVKVNAPTGNFDEQGNMIYEVVEKIYTTAEYLQLLQVRGKQELLKMLPKVEISAEIVAVNTTLRYGEHYELGDIILIKIEEYNLRAKARVVGVKMVDEIKTGKYNTIILSEFEVIY